MNCLASYASLVADIWEESSSTLHIIIRYACVKALCAVCEGSLLISSLRFGKGTSVEGVGLMASIQSHHLSKC